MLLACTAWNFYVAVINYSLHLLTRAVGRIDVVRGMRRAIHRAGLLPVTSFRTEDWWRDLIQDVASAISQSGLLPVAPSCTEDWNSAVSISNPGLFPFASCPVVGITLTNEKILRLSWDGDKIDVAVVWPKMSITLTSMFICQCERDVSE